MKRLLPYFLHLLLALALYVAGFHAGRRAGLREASALVKAARVRVQNR